jgi:hypothetical protein
MKFNRRHILLIIFALALLVLFLPIKVNYNFAATALVYPSNEWYLNRGQDDSFISEMHNFENNSLSNLKNYKFERGDIAEVRFMEGMSSNTFVSKNDTIAYLHSFFIKNELIRLRNLKQNEEAMLLANTAGKKQSLINQAEQEIIFANQQLDLQTRNYNRQLKLMQDSVISMADFEIWENEYNLAKINVEIKKNELLTLQTGEKTEELEAIQQQIDSYSREIRTLEHLESQYYITSPLNGVLRFSTIENGIFSVSDTSRYVLKIPVKVRNIQFMERLSSIKFKIPGFMEEIDAAYIDIDDNVNMFSNQQLVMAKAVITGNYYKVYPGMAVKCNVVCDEITIFEYLKREINLSF